MRSTVLFKLALIASATTITATAAQASEPVTVSSIVRTADLDLASPEGKQELDKRIAMAAREVCGTASDVDLEGKNAVRACRNQTIAHAAAQRERLLAAARSGAQILVASAR